jgi:hypothetical protein
MTSEEHEKIVEQTTTELARRLSAAVLSIQQGLTYATCYNTYATDGPPTKVWMDLARYVQRKVMPKALERSRRAGR